MALVNFNFESQYLQNNTEVSIILPDRPRTIDSRDFYKRDKKYPVLWLLHGTYGDHTDWLRHTMIELYACENDLIVVMPSALNSDYVNWDGFGTGFKMYDFLTEELMPIIYAWFPASDKREDNFIAGLSMGAFGAQMYAVNHPDKFAAVASLSGPPRDLKTASVLEGHGLGPGYDLREKNQIDNAGGAKKYEESIQNTWKIIMDNYETGCLPKLYFACGKEDFLYEEFKKWHMACEDRGMKGILFEEIEGFCHEWRFWDLTIQHAISFFGFHGKKSGNEF